MTLLLLLSVGFLAYSNGANDNFKGVASLFGSRTTSYRTAIGWATVSTFAGSVAAIFLAQALLKRFSGKGLVPDGLVGSEYFLVAVALAAGATVILATLTGFPISTTHALTGAMLGSGWVAVGDQVQLGVLGRAFVLPLLLSPLVAVLLGALLYALCRRLRQRAGITKETCLCLGQEPVLQPAGGALAAAQVLPVALPHLTVRVATEPHCQERYAGHFLGIRCQQAMDAAHFLSAGAVGFARGLNDTPKIAALLLLLPALGTRGGLVIVAAAIALGGLLGARRVAETMSHKITRMTPGQGFAANLSTGLLVLAASLFGLPVSTTHVSCGALFGIGLTTRQADLRVVRNILLSWLVTLPCAALLGAAIYGLVLRPAP